MWRKVTQILSHASGHLTPAHEVIEHTASRYQESRHQSLRIWFLSTPLLPHLASSSLQQGSPFEQTVLLLPRNTRCPG